MCVDEHPWSVARYIARSFEQEFQVGPAESSSLLATLQTHAQYANAMRAAGRLHPDIDLKGVRRNLDPLLAQPMYPLFCPFLSQPQCSLSALVALLVILSEDVYQVRLVFLWMTLSPGGLHPAPCSLVVAMELFYCLATFLYHMWRENMLPQR